MKNEKQTASMPPEIDAEINGLVAKLETKPKVVKQNAFWMAVKALNDKIRHCGCGIAPDRRQYNLDWKWLKRTCHWQLALSILGWVGCVTLTRYLVSAPQSAFQSVIWLLGIILPAIYAAAYSKNRAQFWLSSFAGLFGLPLLFLSSVRLPWYGLAIALAPPAGRVFFLILRTMSDQLHEEEQVAERSIVERRQDPVRSLQRLIAEHRQKIIGQESEFGSHLAKLEDRHSKIRLNLAYWTKRHQSNHESSLYTTRLEAAQRLSDRLSADIEVLRGKKQEIMEGLDQLESRLPQIDNELEDWRRDQELQTLTDEEAQLSRETEEIVTRTVFDFAREMQKIASGIEGLRLNIAGDACDPRLIELTEQRIDEAIDHTRESITTSEAATRA